MSGGAPALPVPLASVLRTALSQAPVSLGIAAGGGRGRHRAEGAFQLSMAGSVQTSVPSDSKQPGRWSAAAFHFGNSAVIPGGHCKFKVPQFNYPILWAIGSFGHVTTRDPL